MTVTAKPKLPDGREMRALADGRKNTFTQVEVFGVAKLLLPSESIMLVKEHDQSIQSGAYKEVNPNNWWRCSEYGLYQKDPKAPLGKEILWIENGVTYKKLVPDVPVKVDGKEISLQKAVGMGVYDSIGLLKIEQTDSNLFVVSVVDPTAVIGKVRVVDFMRDGWALTDESGLPVASKPSSSDNPDARFGAVRTDFEKKATGYHGSLARSVYYYDSGYRRDVYANGDWSRASGVALVNGREAAAPLDVKITSPAPEVGNGSPYRTAPTTSLIHLQGTVIEAAESEFERLSQVLRPEQVTAYRRLLDSLKIKE